MADIGDGHADVVIVGRASGGGVPASRLTKIQPLVVLLLAAGTAYGVDGYRDDPRGCYTPRSLVNPRTSASG
jgi:choline dehydrogenase-like flavoprotein